MFFLNLVSLSSCSSGFDCINELYNRGPKFILCFIPAVVWRLVSAESTVRRPSRKSRTFSYTARAPVLLQPIIGFFCSEWRWKCLMQLHVGSCHVVNAELAVVMAVPIENSARCYSFSAGRWDLRLCCRRGKLSRGIVLLYDNARPHTARQTQALLREQVHWDIFEHPPYSPDLAPSDFSCFQKMVNSLQMRKTWCWLNNQAATRYE